MAANYMLRAGRKLIGPCWISLSGLFLLGTQLDGK